MLARKIGKGGGRDREEIEKVMKVGGTSFI